MVGEWVGGWVTKGRARGVGSGMGVGAWMCERQYRVRLMFVFAKSFIEFLEVGA